VVGSSSAGIFQAVTRRRTIVGLAGFAAAAATGWIVCGSDPITGRVTSYYATCLERAADNRCAVIGRTLDPSVFRVSVGLQRVESVGGPGKPIQLRSCGVISKNDWHCRWSSDDASDDSSELGFSGGRPWLRIHGAAATDLVFLPRWRYLWLKSGEPHGRTFPTRFRVRASQN
jgi:hypothetical protein